MTQDRHGRWSNGSDPWSYDSKFQADCASDRAYMADFDRMMKNLNSASNSAPIYNSAARELPPGRPSYAGGGGTSVSSPGIVGSFFGFIGRMIAFSFKLFLLFVALAFLISFFGG
jgi:hypothetical protein